MSTKPVLIASDHSETIVSNFGAQSDWMTVASMVGSDAAALSLAFGLTMLSRHATVAAHKMAAGLELLPCLAIVLIAFWVQGLYPGVLRHPAEEMRRIYTVLSMVFLGMASTGFLWKTVGFYSRSLLVVAWLVAPPIVLLSRYLLRRTLSSKSWWGVSAVVLGSGPTANRIVRTLRDGTQGIRVTAMLPSERMLEWAFNSPVAIADSWAHSMGPQSRKARYAIVAMPERLAVELRHAIQYYCKGFSHVIFVPELPGLGSLGLSALDIGGTFGVEMPQRLFHTSAAALKRVMDLALGSLALLLVSPLFVAIMLAVKFASRGPVFYGQARLGKNGRRITTWKFRSMVANADSVLKDYLATNPEANMEWRLDHKLKNDPRVTPVGKILRRLSLDELPQLWNVICGQMSLVGPRPIVESEIEKYGRGYELYTRVRPGITGLWQVSGRNNTTYKERVSFDEYYVRNWSCWLDAYLLVCTIRAVVTADGAY